MSKTIQVTKLIDKANAYLEHSPDDAKDKRLAIANFIGSVLHDTGNYAGFNYLQDYHSPDCDCSRVFYYTSHKLK